MSLLCIFSSHLKCVLSLMIIGVYFSLIFVFLSIFTDATFSIIIFHGGEIRDYKSDKIYYGGQVDYSDDLDPDRISIIDIEDMAKSMGCVNVGRLYFRVPTLNLFSGLRELVSDKDVLSMTKWAQTFKVIDVYVDKVKYGNVPENVEGHSSESDGEDSDYDEEEDSMFNGGSSDDEELEELSTEDELMGAMVLRNRAVEVWLLKNKARMLKNRTSMWKMTQMTQSMPLLMT